MIRHISSIRHEVVQFGNNIGKRLHILLEGRPGRFNIIEFGEGSKAAIT
jgi:hypothetical protein